MPVTPARFCYSLALLCGLAFFVSLFGYLWKPDFLVAALALAWLAIGRTFTVEDRLDELIDSLK